MATGDTIAMFDALTNRPPASGAATIALEGAFPVNVFDDGTDRSVSFLVVVPGHYRGGELTAKATYLAASNTGQASLRCELTRLSAGDAIDPPPAADATVDFVAVAPATVGELASATSSSAAVSGLLAGELLLVTLVRRPGEADDTLSGDWKLVTLQIEEA
ncbi:MAG: hypothetical protein RH917_19355 [Lacipirellulaceae bacterium]